MFQDYALFPHMNVADNIRFGLKMHQIGSSAEQMARVHELLELVNLSGFEKRRVAKLSGGEQQRVALARSLAPKPELLMLDEPLGALDASLRQRLIIEIKSIIHRLGLTAIYVTHDRDEALDIADRIAVLNEGRLEQVDTATALFRQPRNTFVARFLGFNNIVPVLDQQGSTAKTPIGQFSVSKTAQALALRPDGLQLASQMDGGTLRLHVHDRAFHADGYHLRLRAADGTTLELVTPANGVPIPEIGDMVIVRVDPASLVALET
jgi:ABC-type Fe3+/spermidine/putrescine transport system ATPase subunit